MRLQTFISDSRFIFFVSIVAGFLFADVAASLEQYLLWIGVVLMTTTLLDVDMSSFHSYKWPQILSLLALNYGVLSTAYVVASLFFAEPYSYGIVFLALMPPSIGVISLTDILRGDIDTSFYAECIAYAVSLVGIPVSVLFFFGDAVTIRPVVRILFYLLVVPFLLSRLLRRLLDQRFASVHSWVKPVFNVCLGLSFFIVIGVNYDLLLGNLGLIGWIAAALIVVKFGLSTAAHYVLRRRLRRPADVDAVLFASFKNGGMAVIFVLAVLSVEASLPLAVNSLIAPFHIIYIERVLLPVLR